MHIGKQLSQLSDGISLEPVLFLHHISTCWANHCEQVCCLTTRLAGFAALVVRHGLKLFAADGRCMQMLTIRSIFLYLDRTYVISNIDVRSLFDMGLQLFRMHLEKNPDVQSKIVTGLLLLIKAERQVCISLDCFL